MQGLTGKMGDLFYASGKGNGRTGSAISGASFYMEWVLRAMNWSCSNFDSELK